MTGAGGGGSIFAFLKPGNISKSIWIEFELCTLFLFLADTSSTVMDMITQELEKMGFELWQPPLGGTGVCLHKRRPEILAPKA